MYIPRFRLLAATLLATSVSLATAPAQWVQSLRSGDIAYFLFAYSPRLERFCLTNSQWLAPLPLPTTYGLPSAFTVDDQSIFVAYGQSVKQYDLGASNEVHLVNSADPVQSIFTDGGIVLVNHSAYLYARFTSLNRTNHAVIAEFENYIDAVVGASIARSKNKVFGRSAGISPADITYVSYRDDGTFIAGGESPYHGDFPGANRTWVFPKDDRVVDTSGTVYSTDNLTYLKSFGGTIDDIDFYGGEIPIVLRGNQVVAYTTTLLPTGSYTLGRTPENIYVTGTNVLAFSPDQSQTNGIWLDTVPLAKLNPPTPGEPVDPTGLVYTPDESFIDTNGVLYLFSKANQSLFRWDTSNQQYLATIPLVDVPGFVAYSDSLHRVYLAYSSGLIRQIDLASTNFAESPFASLPQSPRGLATADSYVFAMDPSGAWGTHYTFDSAGTMVDSRDWNYYSTEFIWSKVNQKMYFFRDDTSPNDLLWEEINANGIAYTNKPGGIGRYMDSPLHDSSGFVHPIRVAPDGSIVVLGSGVIHDAITLARLSLSLGNAINDAAWVGTDLKTVRTINDVSQYQAWTKPNFGLGTVRQFPGTALSLFALQPDRLLGISMLGGRPSFYVLDAQFNVIAPPVLQPPTALSAGVLSATQINLTWQDTSGEESYIIERKTGDDGAWTFLSTASTSATAAADGTVLKGNTYYYRVLASNGSITSAPSAVLTVRLDVPETPTNLVGSALSSSAILLSWANVPGETSYIVERQDAGGSWIVVATVQADTTTWTDSNLSPNTQYTYRLRAVNGIGSSPASTGINVLTNPVTPTAPWFGGANASGPYSISLSWYGSYYQDNFGLERRSGTNDSWHFLAMTGRDITYYEDVGLKPLTYYEYRVYATNAAGASPYAYSSGVTTPQVPPPPAPGYLLALPVSASQVRITWADVSGENGYRIQRSSETTNWVEVAAVPAGTTIFTDTNLLAGVSYSYRVSAYNDYGTSGYSAIATVIPVTVLTLLKDDFDPEPDPAVWASISGAVATNGGAGFQGSHALWFHAGGARAATTVPIKISQGGLLSFQFRAGNEAVDGGTFWNNSEPGEGVLLEYSVDGVQWSLLSSLDTTYPSFSNWTPFSVPVPATAWGPHTQFRWRQVSNSGPSLDCWALEHLRLEGWYPPLSAPAALVAAWQTPTSIGLQWIGVDGADSYSLERQQESGPWLTIAAVATPVSAFTDTNVATNSTYSYRLSAINAGGQSPYSQVAICAPWTPKQAWIYSNYGSADTFSSDEFLNPGPDGIAPLFRYAFNLSAHEPGHVLQPGLSTGGTPAIWLDPIRHRLQVEFVRRKAATNPAIQYQVQFTSSASDWSSPGVELTATQIDATWERVRCEDNTTTAQATARFCRVGIRSD